MSVREDIDRIFEAAKTSLYDEILAAGIPVESHESDLYFPVTIESAAILSMHRLESDNATTFINQKDGRKWYDVPFAYTPWWDKRRTP
jgi:hypothetical protein